MKIKVYIVTYKNFELLVRCLKSLLEGDNPEPYEINVINNYVPRHGESLVLPEIYRERVRLVHNEVRSEYSIGHLARNWNECIIDSMVDINNPQCDILILAQGDTIFARHAIRNIIKHVKKYKFLTFGAGDECQIMTPDSIKMIGMYDERFCGIGHQESDYFHRAAMLGSIVSINDFIHNRPLNPVENNVLIPTLCGLLRKDPTRMESTAYDRLYNAILYEKWGNDHMRGGKQYIMYPHFECSLPDQDKKYYYH